MIVTRRKFRVKQGCTEAALTLLREEGPRMGFPHSVRLYSSNISEYDSVGFEAEFDDLAQYEAFWQEWGSRPTTDEFFQRWHEVTEPGGSNEIWTIETFK